MGNPLQHPTTPGVRHPLTGHPISPIGFRRDGRAIWPILGASEDPPPADPPADPAPTDPGPTPDPPADPDDGKGGKDAVLADLAKERDKRQELEKTVADLQANQQRQMDALAEALGLKPAADSPPDPAELTAQIEAEKANARAAALELAVFKAAADPEVNANAARLLDSTKFLGSLKDIDPSDTAAVQGAIKAAVEADELFKATPAAPIPPFPGGPRPTPSTQAGSLGEAIQRRLNQATR